MKYSENLKKFLNICLESCKNNNLSRLSIEDLFITTIRYILNSSDSSIPEKLRDKLKSIGENKLLSKYQNKDYHLQKIDPSVEEEVLFDQSTTNVFQLAETEAKLTGYKEIEVWHLLLSFAVYDSDFKESLNSCGLNYVDLFKLVDKKESPKLKYVSTGGSSGQDALKDFLSKFGGMDGVSGIGIRFSAPDEDSEDEDEEVEKEVNSNGFKTFLNNIFENAFSGNKSATSEENSSTNYLDKYGKNLNNLALEGKFDPSYGREKEIDLLVKYLGCKKKNNVILLGDPGVGKTTIIEGLATRIAEGRVPPFLRSKIIYSLDLNALVAGTKYRGQYEERLQGVIKDVTKNKNIIVFIDEFHNLVGNGSSEGSTGDASNVLKPYLSRGEFQCIGSTTFGEYRKFIEKDGALKRRFNKIPVYEPDDEECFDMLKSIREKYEEHHGVTYSDEVLRLCISLSRRYITDRFLPDKAIDILDLSGSETKLMKPVDLASETRLKELKELKEKCLLDQNYEELINIRDEEQRLQEKLTKSNSSEIPVTPEVVYQAISKISGVPVDNIGASDMEKLRKMKGILESKVVGQGEAIKVIIGALQRNSLGLRDANKPIASILCVGPSGTGKTYICKQIAKEFFGNEDSLIRFDMSEYTEKHEITKLIGASASYIGYDDEPLFYKIKRKPYSVVLFDEIEKADPGIFPILLNILDEGYVTAANGVVIDFKNTIIVLTGNIGTKDLEARGSAIGFTGGSSNSRNQSILDKAIKNTFAPEFINRLSSIIYFNELTNDDLDKICDLEIKKFEDRISAKGYKSLTISPEIKKRIVSGCDLKYGARDLQREISKVIENSICNYLLENDVPIDLKNINISEDSDKKIVVNFS